MFEAYEVGDFYDEMFLMPGVPRPEAAFLTRTLATLRSDEVLRRQAAAEQLLLHLGITFNVYGSSDGIEKIFPFDLIPRVIAAREWAWIEAGLQQRIRALNAFIADVYGEQRILKDGVLPPDIILGNPSYLQACQGLQPPRGIWCHITGTDLVRDQRGQIYVLEDNLRCPSGVSYVLGNRSVMKYTLPQLFEAATIRPVFTYPSKLLETLQRLAPEHMLDPTVVVLTPGVANAAYFEHSFLAQQMGVELVEGRDLVVDGGLVKMRTTRGLKPVDVIYRRIDDAFLDPETFRPDSLLGVPGLMQVYRAGRVALANAPGTGVADDKAVYAYVPDIIRYYLAEAPIIPNVPTYLCRDPAARAYVLDNLDKLVVKTTGGSGGYGMLVGPAATALERDEFRERILGRPEDYIAQPTLRLSRVPTIVGDRIEGRHVDLRPYILYGDDIFVLPGGLTRVALRRGSLVVNSSQGGGSKDTWVVADDQSDATRP
ncbi:MAG: hypothetical protein CFK52_08685 [Chloracidobacterium sp. CP2_5A]|nr:MAG: hypothetical protein CFK52_08685 [Chloracidobacterium sp. CP2_5A]